MQKAKMAKAKMWTRGFKTAVHKPWHSHDYYVHFLYTVYTRTFIGL